MDIQEPPAFIICGDSMHISLEQETLRQLKLKSGQVVDMRTCWEAIQANAIHGFDAINKKRKEMKDDK